MMDTRSLRYELARMYFDARDYRAAIAELGDLVEETPDDVSLRLLLARAHYHSALLRPAEQHLREVLDRDPNEVYARLMLARVLERQSRQDEAMPHRRILAAMTGDDSQLEPHRALGSGGEQAA